MQKKSWIKYLLSAVVILGLTACGGGGGSTSAGTTDNTGSITGNGSGTPTSGGGSSTSGGTTGGGSGATIRIGSGYYVDAAIAGVTYSCGSKTGVTDSEGKFEFEFGQECRFSLEDILLRIVPAPELFDGVRIFEDITFMAQILQSLDSDGNASNGIDISPDVVALLGGILPADDAALQTFVADLQTAANNGEIEYTGSYVSATEAEEHLEETRQAIDTTAPVIVLNGATPFFVDVNTPFVDPGVTITDDYYNNLNANTSGLIDTNTTGSYTIRYTAVDGAGNSAYVDREVRVVDVTAPVITLTETEYTVEAGDIFDESNVSDGVSAIDDVDGPVSVTIDIDEVQSRTVGDYNVTYSAVDQAGNSAMKTALVHVVDTTAPTISLVGSTPLTIEVAQGSSFTDPGVTISDNTDEQIVASVSGVVNTEVVSTYAITYTAQDSSGNTNQISRTVDVVDTTVPTVTLNGAADMTVIQGSLFTDPGVTATDNSGGYPVVDVSGTVDTSVVNTYELTYTVTDGAGNSVHVTRTVHVVLPPDTTAPVITLSGENPVIVELYSTYIEAGASALDDRDGSVAIAVTGSVDTQNIGTYTITYEATDSAQNTASASRTVEVKDTTPPELYPHGSIEETISVGTSYVEEGAQITGDYVSSTIEGEVNSSKVGDYEITYTATDASGNVGSIVKTVHVVDDIAPVIALSGLNPVYVVVGDSYVDAGATCTDNYDETCTVFSDERNVDVSSEGNYTVLYTAHDGAGNNAEEILRKIVVVKKDTTPDIFVFEDKSNVALSTMQETNITISGINTLTPIAIVNGEYSLDNNQTWTSNEGNVSNGTVVYVRHMSSDEINTTVDTNVTIGGVSDVFSTKTDDFVDNPPVISGFGTNYTKYIGQGMGIEVLFSDDIGVDYCKWDDPDGNIYFERDINPPVLSSGGSHCSLSIDQFSNVGEFTYTLTVRDTGGNVSTKEVTFTVQPNDIPQVEILTADQEVMQGTTLDLNASIVDDNLESFVWYITKPDGSVYMEDQPFLPLSYLFDMPGKYTLKLEVVDSHYVKAFDSVEINVVADTELPTIVLEGDAEVHVGVGEPYVELGAIGSDNVDGILPVSISGTVNTAIPNTYVLTYTAVDAAGNSASISRSVIVEDKIAPVISLTGDATIELFVGNTYTEAGATCVDNYDTNCSIVIGGDTVNTATAGTYVLTYNTVDTSGNRANEVSRTVHVSALQITLLGANPDTLEYGYTYTDPGATVNDPSLTVNFDWNTLHYNTLGRSDLLYEAKDANGNVLATAIRYVDVVDTKAPILSLIGNQSVYLHVGDTYTEQGAECSDNYDPVCAAWVETSNVDTTTSGTYTVVYAGEDSSLNQAQQITRTVYVSVEPRAVDDTLSPLSIATQVVKVLDNDQYEGDVTVEILVGVQAGTLDPIYGTALSTNDGNWSVVNNEVIFNPATTFVGGTVSIRYTINGMITPEATITINYPGGPDTNAPVITLIGDNPYVLNLGAVYVDPGATATDDTDGNLNVTVDSTDVNISAVGTYSVTYTATDSANNVAQATREVQVVEASTFTANTDFVDPSAIETTVVDVLANDTASNGETITRVYLQAGRWVDGQWVSVPVDTVVTAEGNWSVDNNMQKILFTPNSSYGGGMVKTQYMIEESSGATTGSAIYITFPVAVYAEYDSNSTSDINEAVTIDLLANDTIAIGSTVSTSLTDPDQSGNPVWVNTVSTEEGIWNLNEGIVTFTPSSTFGGGGLYMTYRIMDQDGRTSQTGISINYPRYLSAGYHYVDAVDTVSTVTVDVLAGGTFVKEGSSVTVWFKQVDANGDVSLVQSFEAGDGSWSVVDGNVTFVPNEFVSNGTSIKYVLVDQDGRMSTGEISISFPVSLYAQYDDKMVNTIAPANMEVLANDTVADGLTVNVLLQGFDANYNTVYLPQVTSDSGTWTVESNNSVTFTPNDNFVGGDVYMQYKIVDQNQNESSTGISIHYPVLLQANYDDNVTNTIEPFTVSVMDNDEVATGLTATVELIRYDNEGNVVPATEIVSSEGTWSLSGNDVIFTPSDDFLGGGVYVSYRIVDQFDRSSNAGVNISFPALPSPVCTATVLNDIESVYSTIAGNINFSVKADPYAANGIKTFTTRLDTDSYEIVSDVYTAAAGNTPLANAYEIFDEDYIGDEVYLGSMIISLNEADQNWTYTEEEIANDGGQIKFTREENGTYTVNGREVVLDAGFNLKYVRDISANEMQTMLDNAGISIAIDESDTAQLLFMKTMEDKYDWNNQSVAPNPSPDSSPIATLNEFVSSHEYNASTTGWVSTVLYGYSGHGMVFAEGSSGDTGIMVEIDSENNTILNNNAGTWKIETISNHGETFDILSVETTLCGYENAYYRFDANGNLIRGEKEERSGEIKAKIVYSNSLYTKLKQYFIDDASLDISGPYPPSITESMIAGKTFYLEPVTNTDGSISYESLYFVSSDTIEYTAVVTEADGTKPVTNTQNIQYGLDYGKIIIRPYGNELTLISEEATLWNMQDDNGVDQVWLLDKPANYPN